jgi:hypothetical protein
LDIVLKKDSSIAAPNNQELAMTVHDARKKATQQDVIRALDLWKNYLVKSEEYIPFQQRSEDLNIERIRVLKGAMSDYVRFNPGGPQADNFQIYPNPVSDQINIPAAYATEFTAYSIYSTEGKLVQSGQTSAQIDVAKLPIGNYTLVIQNKTQNRYAKVLVVR